MSEQVHPRENVIEQKVEGGLLLLLESGQYVVVNDSGALVWMGIRRGETIDTIVDAVANMEGAPVKDACHQYVHRFISELRESGFLKENE